MDLFQNRAYLCQRESLHTTHVTCQLFYSMLQAERYHDLYSNGEPSTIYEISWLVPSFLDTQVLTHRVSHIFCKVKRGPIETYAQRAVKGR